MSRRLLAKRRCRTANRSSAITIELKMSTRALKTVKMGLAYRAPQGSHDKLRADPRVSPEHGCACSCTCFWFNYGQLQQVGPRNGNGSPAVVSSSWSASSKTLRNGNVRYTILLQKSGCWLLVEAYLRVDQTSPCCCCREKTEPGTVEKRERGQHITLRSCFPCGYEEKTLC